MKYTLALLLIINGQLLFSQISDSVKINKPTEINTYNSIFIDSTALSKNRELNASGALMYKSCNLFLMNTSYFSATSTIIQRGGLFPIYSLNGIPVQTNPTYLNLFNIETIEISNESINKGSHFLQGSINIEFKKPRFNNPLNVNYEGNYVSGGLLEYPVSNTTHPYESSNGDFLSNNISIEKGKDKYAFRFSYSNAISSFKNIGFIYDENKKHLSYNTFGFNFATKPKERLILNTNLFCSFITTSNENSSEKFANTYDIFFFDIMGAYELSKSTNIKTQFGTITSSLMQTNANGETPIFTTISIEKNKNSSEKYNLKSSLSYSFLGNESNASNLSKNTQLHSLTGSTTFEYLKKVLVYASLSNELYNDDYNSNLYFIVPSVGFQFNLLKASTNNRCLLFSNLSYSNRETNYSNLKQKSETGINLNVLKNRVDFSILYYNYFKKNELFIFSESLPNGLEKIGTFKSSSNGIEIKNRNTIIRTKRVNWLVSGNFAWNRSTFYDIKTNYTNESLDIYSTFPEFRLSLSSELSIKSFNINILFDGNMQQQEIYYSGFGSPHKQYSNSLSFRQMNITYTLSREGLIKNKIKQLAVSIYFKNGYTRFDIPYSSSNFEYGQRGLGVNLRLGF